MSKQPISNKKSSTVLEAILLAFAIHAVMLTVIFFADNDMFLFGKEAEAKSKDVEVEFIELTDELLALNTPKQTKIEELLEKYKNVTAKEGQQTSDIVRSYGFNKGRTDEEVLNELLQFEKDEFDKLKKDDLKSDNENEPADNSNDPVEKEKKGDEPLPGNDTSYSKATSTFDFSRDPEYRKTPTYMCRHFGQVVIEIVVNRNGEVTSAKGISGDLNKDCLLSQSENYARKWKFKSSSMAAKTEKGTITFTFLPQKEI